jgi:hypothetical protein
LDVAFGFLQRICFVVRPKAYLSFSWYLSSRHHRAKNRAKARGTVSHIVKDDFMLGYRRVILSRSHRASSLSSLRELVAVCRERLVGILISSYASRFLVGFFSQQLFSYDKLNKTKMVSRRLMCTRIADSSGKASVLKHDCYFPSNPSIVGDQKSMASSATTKQQIESFRTCINTSVQKARLIQARQRRSPCCPCPGDIAE